MLGRCDILTNRHHVISEVAAIMYKHNNDIYALKLLFRSDLNIKNSMYII